MTFVQLRFYNSHCLIRPIPLSTRVALLLAPLSLCTHFHFLSAANACCRTHMSQALNNRGLTPNTPGLANAEFNRKRDALDTTVHHHMDQRVFYTECRETLLDELEEVMTYATSLPHRQRPACHPSGLLTCTSTRVLFCIPIIDHPTR